MKKGIKWLEIIVIIAVIGFFLASCSRRVEAQDGGSGKTATQNSETDFNVTLTANGQAVIITGYIGSTSDVVIPSIIQGMPVREIGKIDEFGSGRGAFENSNITSVIIPEGVTIIGNGSFRNCRQLTTATLPSSLTRIGWEAFQGSGITSIIIPEGVTVIMPSTFNRCRALTTLTLPSTIISIDMLAFENCTTLTTVIIPDTVKEIKFGGDINSFRGASALTLESQATLRRVGYTGNF